MEMGTDRQERDGAGMGRNGQGQAAQEGADPGGQPWGQSLLSPCGNRTWMLLPWLAWTWSGGWGPYRMRSPSSARSMRR